MKTRNNKIKNRRNKINTKKFRGGADLEQIRGDEQPDEPIKTETKNKSTNSRMYNRINGLRSKLWSRPYRQNKVVPENPVSETEENPSDNEPPTSTNESGGEPGEETRDNETPTTTDEPEGKTKVIPFSESVKNEPGPTPSELDINDTLSMEGIDTENQENLKPVVNGIPNPNSFPPSATVIGEPVPASQTDNPKAPTAQVTSINGEPMTQGNTGCPQIVECAKEALAVIERCKGASKESGESKNLEAEVIPVKEGGKKKYKKKRRNTRKPKRRTKKRKSRRRISKKRKNRKH
jgi:hypothetical protein